MLTYLVLLTSLAVILGVVGAVVLSFRREDEARETLADAASAGLNIPASLHPVVSPDLCIGSGACVDACPEQVLQRVDGVTQMIHASDCIGHGRCQASCPVDAIALVFGTAERGVDIPLLRKGYESNLDGVFIVGELGGMGLIRNAMRQAATAVDFIPKVLARHGLPPRSDDPNLPDVIIVGAGPAGLATALSCTDRGLSYLLLEQFSVGGSVTHYPRRKLVFTEQVKLPIVGKFGKSEMLKEELVAEFERVMLQADIAVLEGRRVAKVRGRVGKYRVRALREDGSKETYTGRTLVLAIGRRGTPRRLGVPGEDLPHVVYRLIEPEQYRHRRVLCVGGGDASVEAAVSLSAVAGCEVHLSYRGESFYRVKKKNRAELERALAAEALTAHLQSNVRAITPETCTLEFADGRRLELGIDDVVINIGGVLPTAFLESLGIVVETKHGEAVDERTRAGTRGGTRGGSGGRTQADRTRPGR